MDLSHLQYPFNFQSILISKKKLRNELLNSSFWTEKRIAILGGSTTAEVKTMLEIFLLKEGIKPVFYESEFNKYSEDVFFPPESLKQFDPQIIYFHTSIVNLSDDLKFDISELDVRNALNKEMGKWKSLWQECVRNYPNAIIIQNNFELPDIRLLGNLDAIHPRGFVRYIQHLNDAFIKEANTFKNFFINDIYFLSSLLGLEQWFDKNLWFSYRYAMSFEGTTLIANNLSTMIKAIFGKSKKCLVLDLDNTLWGGVIGDDGIEGLILGPETPLGDAYSTFQKYIKKLKDRGIILAVCSKNDFAIAKSGFNHPDCILKFEDFVSFKANWDEKDKNIRMIAQDLDIGLDSMVFIDDSPIERAFVRAQMPEVAVPEIGQDIAQYVVLLDRYGYFEPAVISEEDFKRSEFYIERNKIQTEQAVYKNYDDFLLSLEMKAEIISFEALYLDRITQLINKTNQFNLTSKRYTPKEVEIIVEDVEYIKLQGRLSDKFGDNGLVSVVVGKIKDSELLIDLWLMSCRVLKRTLENAMMDVLIEECQKRGLKKIHGQYIKTVKNSKVADFYKEIGFSLKEKNANGDSTWYYEIPTTYKKQNRFIKLDVVKMNTM